MLILYLENNALRQPSLQSGKVCSYNPAAVGSNPKDNIYAFSVYAVEIYAKVFVIGLWKNEDKQKEAGIGPFKEVMLSYHHLRCLVRKK